MTFEKLCYYKDIAKKKILNYYDDIVFKMDDIGQSLQGSTDRVEQFIQGTYKIEQFIPDDSTTPKNDQAEKSSIEEKELSSCRQSLVMKFNIELVKIAKNVESSNLRDIDVFFKEKSSDVSLIVDNSETSESVKVDSILNMALKSFLALIDPCCFPKNTIYSIFGIILEFDFYIEPGRMHLLDYEMVDMLGAADITLDEKGILISNSLCRLKEILKDMKENIIEWRSLVPIDENRYNSPYYKLPSEDKLLINCIDKQFNYYQSGSCHIPMGSFSKFKNLQSITLDSEYQLAFDDSEFSFCVEDTFELDKLQYLKISCGHFADVEYQLKAYNLKQLSINFISIYSDKIFEKLDKLEGLELIFSGGNCSIIENRDFFSRGLKNLKELTLSLHFIVDRRSSRLSDLNFIDLSNLVSLEHLKIKELFQYEMFIAMGCIPMYSKISFESFNINSNLKIVSIIKSSFSLNGQKNIFKCLNNLEELCIICCRIWCEGEYIVDPIDNDRFTRLILQKNIYFWPHTTSIESSSHYSTYNELVIKLPFHLLTENENLETLSLSPDESESWINFKTNSCEKLINLSLSLYEWHGSSLEYKNFENLSCLELCFIGHEISVEVSSILLNSSIGFKKLTCLKIGTICYDDSTCLFDRAPLFCLSKKLILDNIPKSLEELSITCLCIELPCFDVLSSLKKLAIIDCVFDHERLWSFFRSNNNNLTSLRLKTIPPLFKRFQKYFCDIKSCTYPVGKCSLVKFPKSINDFLVSLDLAGSPIPRITREMFEKLFHLNTLNLSRCDIATIDNDSFNDLKKIKEISLDHNVIKNISTTHFSNCLELIKLDISKNPLTIDYLNLVKDFGVVFPNMFLIF